MRTPLFTFVLFIVMSSLAPAQALVISEFMAANGVTLSDFEGDSEDWIEIQNTLGSSINLAGFALTDDPSVPDKWVFPSPTSLAGGQRIVVFASGKNRRTPGQELHTNFQLDAGGEHLSLRDLAGAVVSGFGASYPPQERDASYGAAFSGGVPTGQIGYFATPTPSTLNGSFGTIVSGMTSDPAMPTDSDTITVRARPILPPGATLSFIQLRYRVAFGAEITVLMNDGGTNGDTTAGDGEYAGQIPASVSAPGQMVRWRVIVSDSLGATSTGPKYPSTTDSPQFEGTVIQPIGTPSLLETFKWFALNTSAAETTSGTRGSVFYQGVYYDNVFIRARGGSSLGYPKKSLKFDFNPGYHLEWHPSDPAVEEININTTWADKAYVRQPLCYELYDLVGCPGSESFPVRVERNGAFYSVAIWVEQPDERLLKREGLDPSGALYKMYNQLTSSSSGVEKHNRQYEGNSDLSALVSGIALNGAALETYLFDNINIPAVLNYLAATTVMFDNDHVHKNYFLYRDSDGTGEWMFLPWDKDLTLGRNYTLSGGVLNDTMFASTDPQCHPLFGDQQHPKLGGEWNRLIDAMYRVPRIQEMYLRRLRTAMDQYLQTAATPVGQRHMENRIATLQSQMSADVALDASSWGLPTWGSSMNFSTAVNQLLNSYLTPRRTHLYGTHGSGGSWLVPDAQPMVPGVTVARVVADPQSGNQAEEFVQLSNCGPTAIDVSGWYLVAGGTLATIPEGVVIASGDSVYLSPDVKAFRLRAQSPSGGEGLQVVKAWDGDLQALVPVQLYTNQGILVSGGPVLSITTSGAGDVSINVSSAPPFAELWLPATGTITAPVGCGPFLGMAGDALFTMFFPLGAQPFHVSADASGGYSFSAPAGTMPPGTEIDARTVSLSGSGFAISPIVRVTF